MVLTSIGLCLSVLVTSATSQEGVELVGLVGPLAGSVSLRNPSAARPVLFDVLRFLP